MAQHVLIMLLLLIITIVNEYHIDNIGFDYKHYNVWSNYAFTKEEMKQKYKLHREYRTPLFVWTIFQFLLTLNQIC